VATAVGGVPELIVPGISGLLSQPGDWRDIGDNILTLLSDPGLRRRLGAAGRARVERDYKLDRAVASTARVLKRAVNGRAGLST
jgi:glycosyltransferase involved in cell wall biosynthesis